MIKIPRNMLITDISKRSPYINDIIVSCRDKLKKVSEYTIRNNKRNKENISVDNKK
ncbi:MAG: hypothetical protein LBN01_03505 [Endomicrobium sp.]|nr:hypothetical protein [Endomicrobium sp.]